MKAVWLSQRSFCRPLDCDAWGGRPVPPPLDAPLYMIKKVSLK